MEAEDALSDHGVCVRKRYVSSDNGRWFMDILHVADAAGRKEALRARARRDDRPGLLSEVFALHDLRCGTIDARMWTHGGRVAALVCVREEDTGASIHEPVRIRRMESRLRHVLRGGARGARTILVDAATVGNLDRRFHQLLNGDGEASRCAHVEGPRGCKRCGMYRFAATPPRKNGPCVAARLTVSFERAEAGADEAPHDVKTDAGPPAVEDVGDMTRPTAT
ncbi:hypothetical protein QYE76_004567 [Lolium multiflorum]|uniref:ACT domain-containing protein ACR n=1 Tax=Lolium multiflorum TaxID=4521 RepID=A0AAD8RTG3_LOLMU|nr:hypothetical protein QYE76_004567 [Lolium multiflorum]